MAEIIQIGEMRLERQFKSNQCKHLNLSYSEQDQTIECVDCKMQIQPFHALMLLLRHYNNAIQDLSRRRSELSELEKRNEKGLLLATKTVDHVWRSKSMIPTCPHCGRGIMPEDKLGYRSINRQIEIERRKFEKAT